MTSDDNFEDNNAIKYKRILLKLSGEALSGDNGFGIDPQVLERISREIAKVHELGVAIGLVIGGGNFFRGVSAASQGMERVSADHMGMLATVMNALAIQQALQKLNVPTRVQSAIPITPVAEPYIRGRSMKHFKVGRVVVFAAGTGNPLFTTDSAASLRAIEMNAEIMLKATKVDGIYDKDPMKFDDAKLFETLTYNQVLADNLKVMDATAIALCRDHQLPIRVFDIYQPGNLMKIVLGENIGTKVTV
jgi:uridylate kinase (EC 2.7.4.-)